MPTDCGKLKRGQSRPCKPAAGGLKTKLVLVRLEDIAAVLRNATARKNVTPTLATGKKGFLFEGLGDSNIGRSTLVPGTFGPKYTHEIDFASFEGTPENLENLEDLASDPVVAVVPANDGQYKVYGLSAGLKLNASTTDSADADLGAGAKNTLQSTKETGHYDLFVVYDEDGVTVDPVATKAAFEALYT